MSKILKTNEAQITYSELKQQHEDERNDIEYIFFAFDSKQFAKGLEKLGLKPEEEDQICSLGNSGFILRSMLKPFTDLLMRQEAEKREYYQSEGGMLDALVYELENHEFCITGNPEFALSALRIREDEIQPSIFQEACKIAYREEA